jgi:hypothetical protein
MKRNSYNAFIEWPEWVKTLEKEVSAAGVYTVGIESDKKQRGSSINIDLYGYDESQGLAVIQVRECVFHPRRFNKVRKDYYLIGRTESGNVFAHPVETPARSRKALETPEKTISYVLAKIWDCREDELPHIIRQGDIAFIPSALPKGAVKTDNCIVLRETHKITGDIFKANGKLYVQKARMVHTKGQHATVKVKDSWYRIQEGIRASVWGFTTPKSD